MEKMTGTELNLLQKLSFIDSFFGVKNFIKDDNLDNQYLNVIIV